MAKVSDNGPPTLVVFLMQKINLRKENIMTEETNEQVQPVQSVQPVQEETTTIYASTNAVPFAAMIIPKKWALIGNVYPMTTIKPDPSLKSPKMDWNAMKWFENDTAQNGIDMEDLKQKVETLKDRDQESNTKMDQLLQLSIRTNQVLGQLLTNKKEPSVTTSAEAKGGIK
ncbi:hypothetical protein IMAU10149_01858 [Lactobacillus helveticus]|uniref:hypothetical protein n=1 Tax=Lactobacillus helveticus TaxID=1587 RepID=UPI001565DBAE|nr:hypothetical protein [Lactobacillus helveticus]NRO85266.1 hypothetical protein [Lactobacillus helveticus]